MQVGRQYESRLDRKLDVTGDLDLAEEAVDLDTTVDAFHHAKTLDWLDEVISHREGETKAQRIRRIRAALEYPDLDDDV